MEANIHADDVEGCQYTIIEVGSNKALVFITANGDRFTISKKQADGLSLSLRCAGCLKTRTITRNHISHPWATQAVMGAMNRGHGEECHSDIDREKLYVNKKELIQMIMELLGMMQTQQVLLDGIRKWLIEEPITQWKG